MFQCLGLGTVETGGCGEDWWHPQCLMGLPKDWHASNESAKSNLEQEVNVVSIEDAQEEADDIPAPPGFPNEDDFEAMICYKCVQSNPWIKQYAGTAGFLPAVFKQNSTSSAATDVQSATRVATVNAITDNTSSKKRKASADEYDSRASSPSKRMKDEGPAEDTSKDSSDAGTKPVSPTPQHKHSKLPPTPVGSLTLFVQEDFREHLCHCPACFPNLLPHPQLLEEEETYEPPISESGDEAPAGSGARSTGTGSILERGEAALSGVDRVRAIEGVMVYNNLKEKVKAFLKPYAESGQAVGAEDIKAYFEKLRGDDEAIKQAGSRPDAKAVGDEDAKDGSGGGSGGSNRKEQSGY